MSEKSVFIELPSKWEDEDDTDMGDSSVLVNVDYITRHTYLTMKDCPTMEITQESTIALRDFLNREFPS